MVALHLVTSPTAAVPEAAADSDLVLAIHDPTALRPGTRGLLAELGTAWPGAVAFFGDAVIENKTCRRAGWSPTRALTDLGSVLPIAVRAATLRTLALRPHDPAVAPALALSGAEVLHVPTVLSVHPARPWEPDLSAVNSLLAAHGWPVRVIDGARPGTGRLERTGPRPPVSIVIPTAGHCAGASEPRLVDQCLDGLAELLTSADEVLVIVGDEFEGDPGSIAMPTSCSVGILRRPAGSFNFSRAVNQGLLAAHHEAVLLLNDDVHGPDPAALDQLTVHLADPTVAAVGAQLRYPGGQIQHAGMVIDDARPLHSFVGEKPAELARHDADVARDVIAVTGACVLLRRRAVLSVGAMSAEFPLSFNDVDLCLRLRRQGWRVVMEPGAVLTHHEGATRGAHIDGWEWDRWIRRWGEVGDPWYHPGHHRPDDPEALHRNADHLDPPGEFASPVPRGTTIRPRVHHARLA